MESSFGEYITNQYGLLKQILSYLEPSELWIAQLVCRDWNRAIESMTDKNAKLIIHRRSDAKAPVLSKPVLPVFVISHSSQMYPNQFSSKLTQPEFKVNQCNKCKEKLLVCPCTVSGPDTLFISIKTRLNNFGAQDLSRAYEYWQTYFALLLPSTDKIKVATYYERSNSQLYSQPVTQDVVNMCVGGEEPIKCLLIFASTTRGAKKQIFIGKLLDEIVNRQGLTFALGGGDVKNHGVMCKKGNSSPPEKWEEAGLTLVALRGENLSAHSDVLVFYERDYEGFMEQFSQRVGPLPEGGTRIGLVSQCVDRTVYEMEQNECRAFKKNFPTIPLIGFRAVGEYGIQIKEKNNINNCACSLISRDIKRRKKRTFHFGGTSSFVILTFKKD